MERVTASVCLATLASLILVDADPRFPRTGEEWTPESLINPEELGDYFEGDIELPIPVLGKNGLIDDRYRWPEGKVPYTIDVTFSEANKKTILQAMDEFNERTEHCITFINRTSEDDYVLFTSDTSRGCSSTNIGRRGGMQTINYAHWCFKRYGTVLHEMLHALGFHHEQGRYDRDDYVTIMWDNIVQKRDNVNFGKYSDNEISGFGECYDYGSVMHYGAYAFTSNGEKTIVTKVPVSIGQRKGFSPVDLNKLMKMYQCCRHVANISSYQTLEASQAQHTI